MHGSSSLPEAMRVIGEYWIPVEDLEEFDRNIVSPIEVIAEFHNPNAPGTP